MRDTLEIEDAETGLKLTRRKTPEMEFHSRLAISTNSKYLLDAGWFWHPVGGTWLWEMGELLRADGLRGFTIVQDPLGYSTLTHHSNMDTVDHIQPSGFDAGRGDCVGGVRRGESSGETAAQGAAEGEPEREIGARRGLVSKRLSASCRRRLEICIQWRPRDRPI